MDELKEATCGLNYEAEYNRIREKCDCLMAKLADTEQKARYLQDELSIANAKLDMVRLIFGGVNRG